MEAPKPPAHFEIHQEFAVFKLKGVFSFRSAVELVKDAVRYSREQKIQKLLVDTLDVYGFPYPTVVERFWMGDEIAAEAMGAVVIALVARPEMIDPQKFGIVVAQNRGLVVDVFSTRDEAEKWLLKV